MPYLNGGDTAAEAMTLVISVLLICAQKRRPVSVSITLARLALHYTFHRECAEGRVLITDLLLRIASGFPPPFDFIHILELKNEDAIRWGLASY